jgi:hypothetical protein
MNGSSDPNADYTTTLFGKWRKDKAFAYSIFGDNVNPPKINPPTYGLRTLLAANGTGELHRYQDALLVRFWVCCSRATCPPP